MPGIAKHAKSQGSSRRPPALPSATLGASGIGLSRVVLGAMTPTGARREERARVFHAAFDAGVTAVDVAPLYELGAVEEALGAVLAERRCDGITLLTKVGMRWDTDYGDVLFEGTIDGRHRVVRKDARPASIRRDVEESLRRLRVDAIDVVHLHHPDRHTPLEESVGAMADLVREGKVRAIGLSNHAPRDVRRAIAAAGDVPIASVQQDYSLVSRWVEAELLPLCRARGIGFLAYSPLAQGLLAGRGWIRPLGQRDPRCADARFHRRNLARLRHSAFVTLVDVARARGEEPGMTALAFVLAQPGVTAIVVGASTPEQALRNAEAASRPLAAEHEAALRAAFEAARLDPNAGRGLGARLSALGRRAVQKAWRMVEAGRLSARGGDGRTHRGAYEPGP